jgi:multisubunit Na+/H+ antiporter MnhF subunit
VYRNKTKDDLLIFDIIAVVTTLAVIMFSLYTNTPVYSTKSIKISLNSNIKNVFINGYILVYLRNKKCN